MSSGGFAARAQAAADKYENAGATSGDQGSGKGGKGANTSGNDQGKTSGT